MPLPSTNAATLSASARPPLTRQPLFAGGAIPQPTCTHSRERPVNQRGSTMRRFNLTMPRTSDPHCVGRFTWSSQSDAYRHRSIGMPAAALVLLLLLVPLRATAQPATVLVATTPVMGLSATIREFSLIGQDLGIFASVGLSAGMVDHAFSSTGQDLGLFASSGLAFPARLRNRPHGQRPGGEYESAAAGCDSASFGIENFPRRGRISATWRTLANRFPWRSVILAPVLPEHRCCRTLMATVALF